MKTLEVMQERRVLNAGCGGDTYGTDFVDITPQRKEILKCNLDTDLFPYPDESFGEVYSQGNFEHLTNPSNFMQEAHRVLKKGGRLVLITDNASYYVWHFNLSPAFGHRYANSSMDDNHYSLFTLHHLENWMKKFGFAPVSSSYEIDKAGDNRKHLQKRIMRMLLPARLSMQHVKVVGIK